MVITFSSVGLQITTPTKRHLNIVRMLPIMLYEESECWKVNEADEQQIDAGAVVTDQ